MVSPERFRFRRNAVIGATAAEEDGRFLSDCFVDVGDLSSLKDCDSPQRIILGRTGIGKTALISRLVHDTEAVMISPESLSFNYLTNSNILQFFLEAGVKLDLFFKLLWRHVFAVELIKKRYGIVNEGGKRTFLEHMASILRRNKKKERALAYLQQWEDKFWEPTEYRIKEITSKIESELKGSMAAGLHDMKFDISAAKGLTEEERKEVVQRGQSVINEIQMKELTEVLDLLNEDVLDDEEKRYYICVDKLDEGWVEERFRYHLIRSLIDTVRDFLRVRRAKIVIVLRTDLIERVFRLTRDPGFQEEKYRSLYLPIKWSEGQLKEVLDKRVNFLVRQTYTKKKVGYKDLLPANINNIPAIDYMISRTLFRPRDLIEFFNECIANSEGRPTITQTIVLNSEGEYSKKRLRSLQDEWQADYPSLLDFAHIMRNKEKHFRIGQLDEAEVCDYCLDYQIRHAGRKDLLSETAKALVDTVVSPLDFTFTLFHVFYRTGLVGLKTEPYEGIQWSFSGPSTIASGTLNKDTLVSIHPTFWRVLGIRP